MKQITRTVYTFGELLQMQKGGKVNASAVDKARQWMVDGFHCFEWWDCTYETWQSALKQIGFSDVEISFSGFSSQGDGASFTCKNVDVDALKSFMSTNIKPSEVIDGDLEDFKPWLVYKAHGKSPANVKYTRIPCAFASARVTRTSNRYSHENTCTFEIDVDGCGARLGKLLDSFQSDVEQLRRDLCRAIYRDLQEDYEAQTSDEALEESAEANEYTFDENGRRDG